MYHFIINPNSRSGAGVRIWSSLYPLLDQKNIPYKTYFTEYQGHAIKLAASVTEHAAKTNVTTLIAVGGDGTVQEILTGLKNLPFVRFGYIPTGSGNDFCRSMGLPRKPEKALEAILHSTKTTLMDIGLITCRETTSRFAVSCGIGFDAAVCHEISVSPVKKILNRIHLGKLAYLLIGIKQLLFLPPTELSIETDTESSHFYKKVFLTAVMNQKYEGGGFPFCPNANPSDGLLDIIVVEGMSRLKLILCLLSSLFRKHTYFQGVHMIRCQNVTLRTPVALAVHKDGESAGFQTEFSVSLTDKSLQVIVPK